MQATSIEPHANHIMREFLRRKSHSVPYMNVCLGMGDFGLLIHVIIGVLILIIQCLRAKYDKHGIKVNTAKVPNCLAHIQNSSLRLEMLQFSKFLFEQFNITK